jgi:hypothetical protein
MNGIEANGTNQGLGSRYPNLQVNEVIIPGF